jgi:hypothetical protein
MKKTIVVLTLLSLTLVSFAEEALTDSTESNVTALQISRPLYETTNFFKGYKTSQTMRGFQWTSTSFIAASLIQNLIWNNSTSSRILRSSIEWTVPHTMYICPAIGFYVGSKYNRQKRKDPNFHLPQPKYGYEVTAFLNVDKVPKIKRNSDIPGMSLYITGNYDFSVFNEIQLGISSSPEGIPRESKWTVRALKYFKERKIISPFTGCGIGLTNVSHTDKKFLFTNLFAGYRFNLWDFFYYKLELDVELSTHHLYLYQHNHPTDIPITLKLTYGIKLF